ncbi:hypothetical protein ACET3Z_009266 [Daucus carota]
MSSSDPTISQPPKASSDDAAKSKVDEDKQTQVVHDDSTKSMSQDPPHSSGVIPDPKQDDTDKKEVSDKDVVDTADPKADKKEVADEGADEGKDRIDQAKLVEAPQQLKESIPATQEKDDKPPQQSDECIPSPGKKDDKPPQEINESIPAPGEKDDKRPQETKESIPADDKPPQETKESIPAPGEKDDKPPQETKESIPDPEIKDDKPPQQTKESIPADDKPPQETKESIPAPEKKDDKPPQETKESIPAPGEKDDKPPQDTKESTPASEKKDDTPPQQADQSILPPGEKDDKQKQVIDGDMKDSTSQLPQQSDDIAPNTAPLEGDKQTELDEDADKSVSQKQDEEITPDPDQETGDNSDDFAGQSVDPVPTIQNATDDSDSGPVADDALIVLVRRELEYIRETANKLNDYGDIVEQSLVGSGDKIKELDISLIEAVEDKDSDEVGKEKRIRDVQKEIRIFKKHLRKLKLIIPPKFKVNKDDIPELKKYLSELTQNVKLYTSDNKQILGKLDLFKEKINHEYRSAFKDFQARYEKLDYRMKLCLLCFSAIPEHEVIKKRLMVYWWIGEGFIFPEKLEKSETPGEKKPDLEQLGAKVFDDLLKQQFIFSADGKDSQEVDNCKMLPFVRWAVIYMAQRAKFFEFDHDGSPIEDYTSCFRACLSGNGLDTQKAPDLEKLHMLLNVNEAILELKPEWLLKMRNISILCLGRWQAASEHHIEVEDTKFLQALKNMIHLRYLSLQGISRITELPNSVSCLTKLTMLDLRACHNLEIIPRDIGSLRMLTYLDLSECYLLTQMPRGLSKLENLVVLKGFLVVEDPKKDKICTIEDLAKLKKLRKLSIFTGVEAFPSSKDLSAFQKFEVLNKLKIVWGGKKAIKGESGQTTAEGGATTGVSSVETSKDIGRKLIPDVMPKSKRSSRKNALGVSDSSNSGLPKQLQKLDLQCYPLESAPEWLKPKKLENLKKLYIRGGKLRDLNLTNDDWEVEPWNVETLRLKYLTGLGMNWTELLELFPKLIYLEKVRCTKLTLFPCNDKGVWINRAELSKKV